MERAHALNTRAECAWARGGAAVVDGVCANLDMFNTLTGYFQIKRETVARISKYVLAGYFVIQHIARRLDDVRTRSAQMQTAREKYVAPSSTVLLKD